ncbi:MAG: hypothetical protein VXW32_08920 [Myxococcota bacterium]|nr:hypothetical protein [Myxococcota bacterium]
MIRQLIRFQNMDRRWIFLGMALAIVVPLLAPINFPFKIDERVEAIYEKIESLEAGDTVFISADFDPASRPELEPFYRANLHHFFAKDVKVVIGSLWPFAPPMVNPWLEEIAADHGKVDGEDFVFLGFKDGKELAIKLIADDVVKAFPKDLKERDTATLPIMEGKRQLQDFALMMSVSAGFPGTREYVLQVQGQYNLDMASATTAVSAPDYVPYYKSNQLFGLSGGMPGSAQYEKLVYDKYGNDSGLINARPIATQALNVLNMGHLFIVLLILMGNVAFFLTRNIEEA